MQWNRNWQAISKMEYRALGRTGLKVSEIGFGTWGIGGTSKGSIAYGPTDDKESKTALRLAFEFGVTFYDTSDLYGYGHSERLLGAVFRKRRRRVVVASKVGFLRQSGEQDFSPQHIRRSVEGSLRRLQTDYLDVYQLHDPPIDRLDRDERIVRTMEELKTEGKIRAVGISVRSPDDGVVAIRRWRFECLQVNFNMVDQRAVSNGLLDLCQAEGVGVICRTPLCLGFLTGQYTERTVFDTQDHRRAWPEEQIGVWANAHRSFAPVLRTTGQTPAQLALRFCLSYPAVSTAIPGMLTVSQVEDNVVASRFGPLPAVERLAVERVARETSFFVSVRRPHTRPVGDLLLEGELRTRGAV